jgi:6-pyruvoyltetrahydropterin/6-carboxytetrahydropterin synthase
VRFAVDGASGAAGERARPNGYAGNPPLVGFGHYFAIQLTMRGELDPSSQYLINITRIDEVVRERAVHIMVDAVRGDVVPGRGSAGAGGVVGRLFEEMSKGWKNITLERLGLMLSPFLSVSAYTEELPMTRLSQKFEFSASHRLFNAALGDDENLSIFGKCSNPHGHGHNYELQVTLVGKPDEHGMVLSVPRLEQIVGEAVIEKLDHKNLNVEVAQFKNLIPSVEQIAQVIFRMLRPEFDKTNAKLASVTVWETPKTWCEYSE